MPRIIGTSGSRRRRRSLLGALVSFLLLSLFVMPSAFAVHDVGVFQLDGDALASQNTAGTPAAAEDWDNIFDPVNNGTNANPSSFVTDAFGQATDTIYTTGGSKDDLDIPKWRFKNASPSPDKDDLEHGFAAEYVCSVAISCTGTVGDKYLYFGADRFANSGDANIAFWFFQSQVKLNGNGTTTDVCTNGNGCGFTGTHVAHGAGPDGKICYPGQTGGFCPTAGADDTRGDILVVSSFTHGGTEPGITLYEWVGKGNAPANLAVTNDRSVVPIPIPGQNATQGCATPLLTNDAGCAMVNIDAIDTGGWDFTDKADGPGQIQSSEFYEGGLNLTELGLANECFSSFLVNTRSSQSVNSELHDFLLGQLQSCAPGLSTIATPNSTTINPGVTVFDTAKVKVTGGSGTNTPDPTGTVTFKLCFSATATPTCTAANSTISAGSGLLGDTNPKDGTVDDAAPLDGEALALSDDVNTTANALSPGFYCFFATWPGDTRYPGALSATNQDTECFHVKDTSTTVTAQSWVPNDSATVTNSSGGAASGSVVFTLYNNGTCDPGTSNVDVLATFPTTGGITLDANGTAKTNNTTTYVATQPGATISWQVVFTPSDSGAISGSTSSCESSVLTIANNPNV
jgi:hypothetical protein